MSQAHHRGDRARKLSAVVSLTVGSVLLLVSAAPVGAVPSERSLRDHCEALDGFYFSRSAEDGGAAWQCFFTADSRRQAFPGSYYQETSDILHWGAARVFAAACPHQPAIEIQPLVPGDVGAFSEWEITRVACGLDL